MGHIDLATPVAQSGIRAASLLTWACCWIFPAAIWTGCFISPNISLRIVDEDARQKALKRLEDEINVSEREQANQINEKIKQVKLDRDRKIGELNQQKTDLQARSDEQIALRLDPVMKEGQRLESALQERMDQATTKAVVFEAAGVNIVENGPAITAQHILPRSNER